MSSNQWARPQLSPISHRRGSPVLNENGGVIQHHAGTPGTVDTPTPPTTVNRNASDAGRRNNEGRGGGGGGPQREAAAVQARETASRARRRFRKVATKLSKKVVNIKYQVLSQFLGPIMQTVLIVGTALSTGASFGYLLDSVDPKTALQQPPALVPPFEVPPLPAAGVSPATTPVPAPPPTEPETTMPPPPAPPEIPLDFGLWAYSEYRVGEDELMEGVAVSADGSRVATAGRDQRLNIMLDSRNATVRNMRTMEITDNDYYAVAMNHDGSIMAAAGKGGENAVYLLSEDTNPPFKMQVKAELKGHTDWVKSVSLSADGSVLASGSENGEIMLWNTSEGVQMLRSSLLTNAHDGHSVQSVALSADGTRMVSGGADSAVRLWNIHNFIVESAHEYNPTEHHRGVVHAVAISADGTRVAGGSADGDARVWDFDTGDLVGVFADAGQRINYTDNEDVILGVSLNSDGSLLATGSKNGVIRLWNTFDDSIPALHTIDQYIDGTNSNVANLTYVAAVSLNANGTLLAAACKPAVVYCWDVTGVVELLSRPLASTMRQHHNHRKLLL